MPRIVESFALDMAPDCDGTTFLQQLGRLRPPPAFCVYASTPDRLEPAVERSADLVHAAYDLWCYRWDGPVFVQRAEDGVLLFTTADHDPVCLPLRPSRERLGRGATELILTLL